MACPCLPLSLPLSLILPTMPTFHPSGLGKRGACCKFAQSGTSYCRVSRKTLQRNIPSIRRVHISTHFSATTEMLPISMREGGEWRKEGGELTVVTLRFDFVAKTADTHWHRHSMSSRYFPSTLRVPHHILPTDTNWYSGGLLSGCHACQYDSLSLLRSWTKSLVRTLCSHINQIHSP